MAVSSPPVSYEMSDYSGVLRRRWWIVLLVACIGVAAAGLYVAVGHKTYSASALVQVNPLPSNTGSSTGSNATGARTSGTVNMDNQAQLVQSSIVAALANKQLHSSLSLPMLIKQTSVAVPPNTTFLQIGCKESTATAAANCANDFANAYLTYAYGNSVSAANQTLSTLTAEIKKLTAQIRGLKIQLAILPGKATKRISDTVALAVDNIAVDGLENQLNTANAQLAALTSGAAGNVASPAIPPTSPISPRATLFLPSGLVAGLVIGLLLAFVVDRRDKRIHSSRDLERFFGVPVLLNSVRRSAQLEREIAPAGSDAGRAFAELGQAVAASFTDDEHFLLVVGTSSGNGSGIVAANVAATLARSRSEVVLICAGTERSIASRLFGAGQGPGLSELLAGKATLSEAARRVSGIPRLRVIAPGHGRATGVENPHAAAGLLLAELSTQAQYVIVEISSIADDSDTFTMAEFADGALVSVDIDRTTRYEVADCVQGLQRVQVPVIGAAVLPKGSRGQAAQPAQPPNAAHSPADEAPKKAGVGDKVARASVLSAAKQPGNGAAPPAAGDGSHLPPATVAPRPPES